MGLVLPEEQVMKEHDQNGEGGAGEDPGQCLTAGTVPALSPRIQFFAEERREGLGIGAGL